MVRKLSDKKINILGEEKIVFINKEMKRDENDKIVI